MEYEKEKIAKGIEQKKFKLEQNQKEAAAKVGGARKKNDEREGYRKGNERDKHEYRDRRYGEHQRNSDDEMRRERRFGRYNGDEWKERRETRHDRREYDRHEFRFGDGNYHNYGSYREGSRRSQSREYSCGNRRRETSSDSRRGYRESSRDTEYFADTLNRKIDPPPTWDENMSVDAWARYVRIWNKVEAKPFRKVQALVEMLKKDSKKGLKEMIVNEVIENKEFDLESRNAVENIIKKVREFTAESLWSRNVLIADEFCKFEQKVGESNIHYISCFGNLETRLKTEEVDLKGRFLAAILLNKSRIPQNEKNNILANFDLENEDQKELLKKIKKKIRDLDVVKEASKEEVKETLFGDRFQNEYYRRRSNYRSRSRSRYDERGNGGHDRFKGKSRSRSRSRSDKERNRTERSSSQAKRTYKCDKLKLDTDKNIFENKVENKAVLDSGCPEIVGGTVWLKKAWVKN